MADNVHPVVELLTARMESHPEEFRFHDSQTLAITGRWETWIHQIRPFLNEAEDKMLFGKAKEAFLQRVHEEVLDELLNGEERRAQEKRERDLEMQRMMAQAQQQSAAQQAAQLYSQQNAYPHYNSVTDTYEFGNGMKMTKAQIENNPGLVNSIKKALGL